MNSLNTLHCQHVAGIKGHKTLGQGRTYEVQKKSHGSHDHLLFLIQIKLYMFIDQKIILTYFEMEKIPFVQENVE